MHKVMGSLLSIALSLATGGIASAQHFTAFAPIAPTPEVATRTFGAILTAAGSDYLALYVDDSVEDGFMRGMLLSGDGGSATLLPRPIPQVQRVACSDSECVGVVREGVYVTIDVSEQLETRDGFAGLFQISSGGRPVRCQSAGRGAVDVGSSFVVPLLCEDFRMDEVFEVALQEGLVARGGGPALVIPFGDSGSEMRFVPMSTESIDVDGDRVFGGRPGATLEAE